MKSSLTVVFPIYNHAELAPKMLDSILSQSLLPDEIIAIEDASTDCSLEVVEQYAERHNIIRVIKNEQNQGVVHGMNRGLKEAKGKYIVFLAADDLVFPSFFEKSLKLLEEHQDAAFCSADTIFFEENTGSKQTSFLNFLNTPGYLSPQDICCLLAGRHFYGPSTVLRAEFVRKAQGFIPGLKWHCDWFLFLVLAFRHGICFIPEALSQFRVTDSYSANMHDFENQDSVNVTLIELLRGPFQDVMSSFMKSGATDSLGPSLAETVFSRPEFWSPEINLLIQRNLWHWNNQLEANQQDRIIVNRLEKILGDNEDRIHGLKDEGDIWIYGAGKHTEQLLNLWEKRQLPPISKLVVSGQPYVNQLRGIPVSGIDQVGDETPKLIVVSSKTYEHDMLLKTEAQFPEANKLAFWVDQD